MTKAARAILLALLSTFAYSANFLINDHLLSPRASELIEKIGSELKAKTGVNAYAIATNDHIPRNGNLFEYIRKYESELSKPYVIFLFAPNSKRIGLLPSDKKIGNSYDPDRVKDFAIKIISSSDSNSQRSKYDVAVVQAYSELADELAEASGKVLENTIKSESGWLIRIVTWAVYIGSLLVFWVYFGRPLYMRIRYGKKQ